MKIPLFPLEVVLFPGAVLPLHIFEERYKEMISICLAEKLTFGVVCAQREGLAVVGCTAEIVRVLQRYPDDRLDILCQGIKRFEIENLDNSRNYLQAEVDFFSDNGELATRPKREECIALHFEVLELMGRGKGTREAAEKLHLSVKTVEVHRANIKKKLGLKTAPELMRYAVRWVESQAGN